MAEVVVKVEGSSGGEMKDEKEWTKVMREDGLIEEDMMRRMNAPGDGSCLFWAVTMAYLLPQVTDSDSEVDSGGESDQYEDYYVTGDESESDETDSRKSHPEYFPFESLSFEEVELLLNETVQSLSHSLQVTPSIAKLLLHSNQWNLNDIMIRYKSDADCLMTESRIKPIYSSLIHCQV